MAESRERTKVGVMAVFGAVSGAALVLGVAAVASSDEEPTYAESEGYSCGAEESLVETSFALITDGEGEATVEEAVEVGRMGDTEHLRLMNAEVQIVEVAIPSPAGVRLPSDRERDDGGGDEDPGPVLVAQAEVTYSDDSGVKARLSLVDYGNGWLLQSQEGCESAIRQHAGEDQE